MPNEELIRADVTEVVRDAIVFAHKSDADFYSNCMLYTHSEPVTLPAHFGA